MLKNFAFSLMLILALPIGAMAAGQSGQQIIDQQRQELTQFEQQIQLQQQQQQLQQQENQLLLQRLQDQRPQ
jgi:hypothetical protein